MFSRSPRNIAECRPLHSVVVSVAECSVTALVLVLLLLHCK